MGPQLVDYLLYEKEDNGILWIKFNRPEKMNALYGTAESSGTVAKVGEYMRAADDDRETIAEADHHRQRKERDETIQSERPNTEH